MTMLPVWKPRKASQIYPNVACVFLDAGRGRLAVEHDGGVTWDTLQDIKNDFLGPDAVAIEIYPPARDVLNMAPIRHLWQLGPDDWWPDLTRMDAPELRTLRGRFETMGRG